MLRLSRLLTVCFVLCCGLVPPQSFGAAHPRPATKASSQESSSRTRVTEPPAERDADHPGVHDDDRAGRAAWFREGRTTTPDDEPAAAKLHRAFTRKLQMRKPSARDASAIGADTAQPAPSSTSVTTQSPSAAQVQTSSLGVQWRSLGPAPIQANAGENYGTVTGRVTAIAVDPGDPTGNTVFIGAGGGGVWKSTNAAGDAASVQWIPLSDTQPSLSIGALALQPGNSNCKTPSAGTCVILAGTGETDNSGDSYYGLGILRSTDGGQSWTLIDHSADGKLFHGIGFAAVAFNSDSPNVVVAAAAAASESAEVGAEFAGSTRGAYYSNDSGATWNYAQFSDSTQTLASGSSVTSVVYDTPRHLFFAAVRSHGIYSSSDGAHWTRLASQPGGAMLSTTACPASTSASCPLYRAELAVQPQTGDLFTWIVDSSANDKGIFKSSDGGNTWMQIHIAGTAATGDGIENCGDSGFSNGVTGCGTDQATFNMVLMALPTSAGTDVYAGAVNLFRCSVTASNPTCQNTGSWINLTHVYGCTTKVNGPFQPNSHSDQHSIAFVPGQPQIIFSGNDGGLYRSLNAPMLQGACNAPFDNLNAHLGPLTQLVGFSQDSLSQATLQIGSQDNGTAATTDTITWSTIESGDGGYSEIDSSGNWLNSGNYVDIAACKAGTNCAFAGAPFSQIVNSSNLGNDVAPFFMRYILDPGKAGQILIGTCRVWRGSATTSWSTSPGTAISGNLLGTSTTCQTSDDMIRAMAAGGPAASTGASVIYVGTTRGFVWVRSSSQGAWSGGPLPGALATCGNGNARCPISDIALDRSNATGATAYLTVMGFGTPHVYKTTNFGAGWTNITANLPDVPANAVLVDPNSSNTIYVGTDIGVFVTTDGGQSWNEYGANLPTVPVTQLRAFPPNGSAQLLRASTYGRGLWQAPLAGITPDFQLTLSGTSGQSYPSTSTTIQGTIAPSAGYAQAISVSCDTSNAPTVQCDSTTVNAGSRSFSLAVSNSNIGDFSFNILARGADGLIHTVPYTLHVGDFSVSLSTGSITAPHSSPQNVAVNVSTSGSYSGTVTLGCSGAPAGMTCSFSPPTLTLPASSGATATIFAGSSVATDTYSISVTVTAADGHVRSSLLGVTVGENPMIVLTPTTPNLGAVKIGQPLSATLSAASQDGFSGSATLSCAMVRPTSGSCAVSPTSVTLNSSSGSQPINVSINTTNASPQSAQVNVTAVSNGKTSQVTLNYSITDFAIASTSGTFLLNSTAQVAVNISPLFGYTGTVNATCDVIGIAGASCTLSPPGPYVVNGSAVNLTANLATSGVSVGNYSLKINATDASYSSLAHATTANISIQDFAVVPQVQSLTVPVGQAASAVVSIAAQNGFSAGVSFSCSGLPPGATCLFTPNVLTSVAGGATTTMTISTLKASASQAAGPIARNGSRPSRHTYPFWGSLPVFAIFGWISGEKKRRRRWMRALWGFCRQGVRSRRQTSRLRGDGPHRALCAEFARGQAQQETGRSNRKPLLSGLLLGCLLLGLLFGCGGNGKKSFTTTTPNPNQPGTPTGNYTITIIATSGSAQRSATINLLVQ